MYFRMAKRLLIETDKRALWKLFWNMGIKGALSVFRFKRRLRRGSVFPPFLYISVINSCNLRCQGCWVDVAAKQQTIDRAAMRKLIDEAKANGNVFFGIVGGEPFMHPELLDILADHPDCYFQVFTNGHFITDDVARRLRQLGNVTPLISVEGTEIVSNERRGRAGVLSKTMQGIQNCLKHKVFTGVCTSVCTTNIDDLVTEAWVDRLIEMGVFYTWFHVYRPMGPEASPELCLTQEQQQRIRRFVVDMRCRKPIIIVDAYYDHDGQALCPAATGITHHINPWGGIEPCPIIQFTTNSIHEGNLTLAEKLDSPFLRDFRDLARKTTRGCIVLERPDLLRGLIEKHHADDGTARQTALAELEGMQVRPSQYNPADSIPEKSWAYRIAKRHFFNDFGAYTGHDHSLASAPAVLSRNQPASPALVQLQTAQPSGSHDSEN
jgi:MoaA/NifB/PqqE/SkfB family radical SAM enzyme